MRRLYTIFTKPNEIILDCFNGAGTSTLVAHQMNRRFIGIEMSVQYHKIAQDRHDMILQGEDPFGKREEIPQAKNSRVERLQKQKYEVSKKDLQLEVRQIARTLGRLPTRDDVIEMSEHPIEYFDNYFLVGVKFVRLLAMMECQKCHKKLPQMDINKIFFKINLKKQPPFLPQKISSFYILHSAFTLVYP